MPPFLRQVGFIIAAAWLLAAPVALAQSEPGLIPREDIPDAGEALDNPSGEVKPEDDDPQADPDLDDGADRPGPPGPPPPVLRDLSALPEPVRRTHRRLLDAARAGRVEALRRYVGLGETATVLSIGGLEGDPIDFLKASSGDEDGFEILAILKEVLEAGHVHLDAGTEQELYVWPYFFAWPFDALSEPQKVELFSVLTAGDVEDSRSAGRYVFYRVGIRPDGTWAFFVAGE